MKAGSLFSLGLTGFAWINVELILVWLWIASALSREHKKLEIARNVVES